MPGEHALLSPSGASRWLTCTPSARLELNYPDASSVYADEGTLAHKLGDLLIQKALGRLNPLRYSKALTKIQKDKLFKHEMTGFCEAYRDYVLEVFEEAKAHTKDAVIFLEQKLDLTPYIPEGYGTGDVVIVADTELNIIDFKYGKGVAINAVENKQMMCYALGALLEFDFIYDIQSVKMTIVQPRLDSITVFEMAAGELRAWGEEELKPRAVIAFAGKGEFVAGDHCRFCRAKAGCRALADFNMSLAKYDFAPGTLLEPWEISDILDKADGFIKWIAAVENYALHEAVNNGKVWPGHKVVEGRSNRAYSDVAKVAARLIERGWTEDKIYRKTLLPLGEMESLLTKTAFQNTLSDLIAKPAGKPTLAPESDKRPSYHSNEAAKQDFLEYIEVD